MTPDDFIVVWDGTKQGRLRGYLTTDPDIPKPPPPPVFERRTLASPGMTKLRIRLQGAPATIDTLMTELRMKRRHIQSLLARMRRTGELQQRASRPHKGHAIQVYWIDAPTS